MKLNIVNEKILFSSIYIKIYTLSTSVPAVLPYSNLPLMMSGKLSTVSLAWCQENSGLRLSAG